MEDKLKQPIPSQVMPNVNAASIKPISNKEEGEFTFLHVSNKNKSNINYLTEKINDLNKVVIVYGGKAIDNINLEDPQRISILHGFNIDSLITEDLLYKLDTVINNLKALTLA